MKFVVRLILGVTVTLALVGGSACGASTSTSSSTSHSSPNSSPAAGGGNLDVQVAMPAGFPADFPIYPGARLVSAGNFASNGSNTWSMAWETVDSVDKAQAFYTAQLAQGDWTLSFSGSSNGAFSAIFNRKSGTTVGGILGVGPTNAFTTITLALTNGG